MGDPFHPWVGGAHRHSRTASPAIGPLQGAASWEVWHGRPVKPRAAGCRSPDGDGKESNSRGDPGLCRLGCGSPRRCETAATPRQAHRSPSSESPPGHPGGSGWAERLAGVGGWRRPRGEPHRDPSAGGDAGPAIHRGGSAPSEPSSRRCDRRAAGSWEPARGGAIARGSFECRRGPYGWRLGEHWLRVPVGSQPDASQRQG